MGETHRRGKKSRKSGRLKRKPSHIRYTTEKRWEKNKVKRVAKIKRDLERKAARKLRRS